MPELAVAYREDELHQMIAEANLIAKQTYYGTWCGRREGLSFQDMLLLRPA